MYPSQAKSSPPALLFTRPFAERDVELERSADLRAFRIHSEKSAIYVAVLQSLLVVHHLRLLGLWVYGEGRPCSLLGP